MLTGETRKAKRYVFASLKERDDSRRVLKSGDWGYPNGMKILQRRRNKGNLISLKAAMGKPNVYFIIALYISPKRALRLQGRAF